MRKRSRRFKDAGPAEDIPRARRVAIETCKAIIDGKLAPYEGAHKIWWEAWAFVRYHPLGNALVPFIGEATEWQDHPEAREEIENSIRKRAQRFLDLWPE
jgi:hypothetical protein